MSSTDQFKLYANKFAQLDNDHANQTRGKKLNHKPSLILRVVLGAINGPVPGSAELGLYRKIEKEWEQYSDLQCDPKYLMKTARHILKQHPELGFALPPAKLGPLPAYIKQSADVPLTDAEQTVFDAGMTSNMVKLATHLKSSLLAWRQFEASYPEKDKAWIEKAIDMTRAAKHAVEDAILVHTYKKTEATTMRHKRRYNRRKSA